jgi:cell division protease FtsH
MLPKFNNKKPLRSYQIIAIFVIAMIVGFVGAGLADNFGGGAATSPQDTSSADKKKDESKDNRSPIIQEMTKSPSDWRKSERDYSSFANDAKANNIAAVGIIDEGLFVSTEKGDKYIVNDPYHGLFWEFIKDYSDQGNKQFPLSYIKTGFTSSLTGRPNTIWGAALQGVLFPLLLIGLILGGFFLYGRLSKFYTFQHDINVRFSDVIGANDAKASFVDVVSYLESPERFAEIGAKPPKGILLAGPPGVGKTLLAKALAGECGVNFISITGGDFSSKFYGVGIQRVKALFKAARSKAPCIIFIDEADGLGRRVEQSSSVDAESNRIINQILAEMDGFNAADGVIVIGATNYANSLDPAMTREGRFDRKITVSLPGLDDRKDLFNFYLNKVKTIGGIDVEQLARLTIGLSPASISYLTTHAAFLAAKRNSLVVEMADLLESIETFKMGGKEGSPALMTPDEKVRIAYHEAGHALIASFFNLGIVEKVTILPRGEALGVTVVTPERDKSLHLKSELEARIKMLLAGRLAELSKCSEISSGASSDLKEASKLAFNMVAQLGMSDRGDLFSVEALRDFRLEPNQDVYVAEANKLLSRLNDECSSMLHQMDEALETIARALIEHETIDGIIVSQAVAKFKQ